MTDNIEAVARMAHEVNRAWCERLGDASQLPWDAAPAWARESAIAGVRFHLANPGADDAASHESWRSAKIAAGWVYGPVKDADAKVHPCMVPFGALPSIQQFKDRLFRTVVHAAVEGGLFRSAVTVAAMPDDVRIRLECLTLAIDAEQPQPLPAAREWSQWVLTGEPPAPPAPVSLVAVTKAKP